MKKTYVIGISGASGSGKSTFTERLADYLSESKIKIIHMDEYYKTELQRPRIKGIVDNLEYIDDNHPLSLDLDRCYIDCVNATNCNWDILIIEGIFAFGDERFSNLSDLKIFVDCEPDERFKRRILRNLSFGQDLEEILSRYVQAVQPRQREYVEPTKWKADIIINGFSFSPIGLEIIGNWIKENYR